MSMVVFSDNAGGVQEHQLSVLLAGGHETSLNSRAPGLGELSRNASPPWMV